MLLQQSAAATTTCTATCTTTCTSRRLHQSLNPLPLPFYVLVAVRFRCNAWVAVVRCCDVLAVISKQLFYNSLV